MRDRFNELRRVSWDMPDSKQKLAVLEEMIAIADRYMTEEDAYNVRMDYMTAAVDIGYLERMLVAFSWCLSKYDRTPSAYSQYYLMWHYKWVINDMWRMPEFSLAQVDSIFEDFKERCLKYGYNLRPYYHKKVNYLLSQGMISEAAQYYKLWRSTPRDDLADCKACEQNMFGIYSFRINHVKKGLQTVKPILNGKMVCSTIPQNTFSQVIIPLLKMKEYEQAASIAKKAYRVIKGPRFLEEHGMMLEFYTVTSMDKAVKIYNDTIRYGLESKVGWDKFNYFLSVRIFLREWHRKKRRRKLAEDDRVTLDWLDQEIAALADAFNRRNGNDYVNEFIVEKEKNTQMLIKAYQLQS
ncbi:hypothetical protein [Paenibacillus sp. 481]|uniref:hypothetical protein n=1 Tax=Paenibacillus sp. 481 TaxID=2835869 RepID=UPI001E2F3675|nr:hypothetical protein [Paenibacillus sp. 481]UHA74669.1 hypothetical protein KIK04_06195 [Paenibacillus sp. 481]